MINFNNEYMIFKRILILMEDPKEKGVKIIQSDNKQNTDNNVKLDNQDLGNDEFGFLESFEKEFEKMGKKQEDSKKDIESKSGELTGSSENVVSPSSEIDDLLKNPKKAAGPKRKKPTRGAIISDAKRDISDIKREKAAPPKPSKADLLAVNFELLDELYDNQNTDPNALDYKIDEMLSDEGTKEIFNKWDQSIIKERNEYFKKLDQNPLLNMNDEDNDKRSAREDIFYNAWKNDKTKASEKFEATIPTSLANELEDKAEIKLKKNFKRSDSFLKKEYFEKLDDYFAKLPIGKDADGAPIQNKQEIEWAREWVQNQKNNINELTEKAIYERNNPVESITNNDSTIAKNAMKREMTLWKKFVNKISEIIKDFFNPSAKKSEVSNSEASKFYTEPVREREKTGNPKYQIEGKLAIIEEVIVRNEELHSITSQDTQSKTVEALDLAGQFPKSSLHVERHKEMKGAKGSKEV